ncbi:MAG: hypothetical protein WBE02_13120 [Bradyrhizobium sp.]|jgi:hypothetical protein
MSSWLERWCKRESDLAQGADADLVRDNRNRYKFAFGLIGIGFLLGLLYSNIQIPNTLRSIVLGVALVSVIGGFLLAAWARQEEAFLNKPDSEEPPRIFRR